jgi:hypothetical protein
MTTSADRIGTNTGHGHIWERPDGIKMRCGGPGICKECTQDAKIVALTPASSTEGRVEEIARKKLLPCPFCGSRNVDPEGWVSTDRSGPACDDCCGSANTVELWNSRPSLAGDARNEALEEALVSAAASLAAAISLLENTPKAKKSAPSDKMFDIMLNDYHRALEGVRKILS